MKKTIAILIIFISCSRKDLYQNVKILECQHMIAIPEIYSYNEEWMTYIGKQHFQIKRLEKIAPNGLLDTLVWVHTEFALYYLNQELKNDSSLAEIYHPEALRIAQISKNILVDGTDTFFIKKYLNQKSCLVYKKEENNYRLYKFY